MGAALAPAQTGSAPQLVASQEHPLAALGLDINSNQGPALLASLAQLPGAPQAEQAREAAGAEALIRQQQPQPSVEPWQAPQLQPQPQATPQQQLAQPPTAQPQQVQEFNQQLQDPQVGPQAPEPFTPAQEEWEHMMALIQSQGEALAAVTAGQTPAPGPSGVPAASFVAPAAAPGQPVPAAQPQIPAIAVPQIAAAEIGEGEFEKLTTDRAAFAAFLNKRDQLTAATVTEQLAQTILPHVHGMMSAEMEKQQAINEFVRLNPDFQEHQEAVTQAITEAKRILPYAKPKEIMYYAGHELRKAMATNAQIETSVIDLRGNPGRRSPAITNPAALRRGPGNEPPANPFGQLATAMVNLKRNQTTVLEGFGLTGAPQARV